MMALGRRASISATGIAAGTISEYTRHSRTRRAISCAYWAPKSTTRTVSGALLSLLSGDRTAGSLVGRRGRLLARGRGHQGCRAAHRDAGDAPTVQLGHGQLGARDLHRFPLA